tara:strand:+ start:148 stop:567 length:420 start_codon:yes stop_codon:yes gene_type:complete
MTNELWSALIGFDTMFNTTNKSNYPPYNIYKTVDTYTLEIAVAGFEKDELLVSLDSSRLQVSAQKKAEKRVCTCNKTNCVCGNAEMLVNNLASRSFTKIFHLAQHTEVVSVDLKNGILTIKLEKVLPDELKPRVFEIGT